jgi:predicted RND superfamily exporter protein
METDLDEYMPQKHPAFVYSNLAEDWFNIKDGIIIAIKNQEGMYNSNTLHKVRDLTRELQKLEEIEKDDVNSLYTAENIIGTEDGLDVRAFYKKVPQTQQELDDMGSRVRENEMVFKRLVSADEKSTLIIARIGDDVFSQEFYHKILGMAEAYEGPEHVYVAGRPIVEGTMAYLGPRDMKRMAPLVLLVIFVVLLLVLRSIKNTLLTLSVVILSIIWSFGLMAILNIPIYAVSTMIPVMLIAIGVADSIHLMGHIELYIRENPRASKKAAVADMLNVMWKPVAMTSVTTMVGFSSLVTSRVYPVKYFGLFTAFGVGVALAMSLILIPAGIMIVGLQKTKKGALKNTRKSDGRLAHRFSEILTKRPYITLAAAVIIVGTAIFGIGKVWINSSFIDNFERDSDIVQTDAFINKNFGGTSTLNVIVEGKNENTMKGPTVLRILEQMQNDAESLDMVGTTFGLTDYLKRMNKVMHADNPVYDTIPDSQELIAQYLLLYEMSGDPENLWRVVDYDYKKGNITLQLKSDDSRTIKSAISVIEPYLEDLQQQGVDVYYAGSGYKGLVFTDLILKGQVSSLMLALGIVIILIALMFKKIVVGLIGSLPIVITAIINFGIMGLLRVPLSMTTALVSSIAIGAV